LTEDDLSGFDYEAWKAQRDAAEAAWRNGASVREVAKILGTSASRAGQVCEGWRQDDFKKRRRAGSARLEQALLLLIDNGFSEEEAALFFALDGKQFAQTLKAAMIHAGRIEPPHDLELSIRAQNVLNALGAETLRDICAFSAAELLRTPNCGRKTLAEIEAALEDRGLALRLGLSTD
jgi:DNA-directed RNA polymerase alpha subunit